MKSDLRPRLAYSSAIRHMLGLAAQIILRVHDPRPALTGPSPAFRLAHHRPRREDAAEDDERDEPP